MNLKDKTSTSIIEIDEGSTVTKDKPIGKRLKAILLIPLLIGVILSSIIVIGVVFTTHKNWVTDTEVFIKSKEAAFMTIYLKTIQETLGERINLYYFKLEMLSNIFEDQENSQIIASGSLQNPVFNNSRNFLGQFYPQLSSAEWYSSKNDSFPDQNTFKLPDTFLRTYYSSSTSISQLGYLINEAKDLLYLYPIQDMSYINSDYNYSKTCNISSSKYKPICSESYDYLFKQNTNLLIYYENNRLYIMNNFSSKTKFRASLAIFNKYNLAKVIQNNTGYQTFACQYQGKWTLLLTDTNPDNYIGADISQALYSNDTEAIQNFKDSVVKHFNETSGSNTASIKSENFLFAFTKLNLYRDTNDSFNYTVCAMKSEKEVLKSWLKFNGSVLNIMIIQSCIFAAFVIITIIVALLLTRMITNKVSNPIQIISSYLDTSRPALISIDDMFNNQLNTLVDTLKKIEEIELFIDPSFLMNPILAVRLNNLEKAYSLFASIDNKTAASIALNLMGNINVLSKNFKEAESNYRKALNLLYELLHEIKQEETKTFKLKDKELNLLGINSDEGFWITTKKKVKDKIADQIQQLSLAITLKLKEENNENTFIIRRRKWKQLIHLQSQALQHYINTKENIFDCLNLLINISEIYQILNYSHTSKELLSLVYDEVHVLQPHLNSEIDIDVRRLRNIGIDVKESKKKDNFKVNEFTFEKDILMQRVFYCFGMLNLSKDLFDAAANDFQLSITTGTYYDPEVRKASLKELTGLFKRFEVIIFAPELDFPDGLIRKNIVLGLAFNLKTENDLSDFILNFASDISDDYSKLGAVCSNCFDLCLDLHERDFPSLDVENLIIQSRLKEDNENLFDLIGRAADVFNSSTLRKDEHQFLIVFYKQCKENPAMCSLETLQARLGSAVNLVFITFGDYFALDFEIFMENLNGEVIKAKEFELKSCEERIKNYLEFKISFD